ncbi:Primary amine oxidase, partial [Tetrabaena socialis]
VNAHPLDQLSVHEIRSAADACTAWAASNGVPSIRFNTVMLLEPAKKALLAFERGAGPRPDRVAECILIVPTAELAVEALVVLSECAPPAVTSWKNLDGVHPLTSPDDNTEAEAVVKACPRIAQLMAERYGITDIKNQLICDTWACHNAPEHLNHRRLMQGFLYLKLAGQSDNEYAHPIDMVPIVDLNLGKVLHIDMYDLPAPVPRGCINYHPSLVDPVAKPWRDDVKPLHVVQPEGPSFSLDGNELSWQRWRVRLGFNGREGLVLHNLTYLDGGRRRPVMHRASLVEMAVPYGDPNMPYVRKAAFDVGDYGFGLCANSLELGCDCLGHIQYMDAIVNNCKGEPVVIRKAICIHEEDAGILWKHWDCRTHHSEVRRSRRLVVSMVSTFMNYEYALYWSFYQDGTIHFELKLTGILSTSAAPAGETDPAFGVRVAPGVHATVHQHFFGMRLDPAIDDEAGGKDLIISEVEAVALPPGPANPYANGFRMQETELVSTSQAQRVHNFATARFWSIKNPFSINPVSGRPVSYRLMPAASPWMMAAPDSLVACRAVFATKQLWVTPHADDQRYPAGEHVVQSTRCMGLAEWTRKDTPLLGADPVIWYSFGVTHAPRVEDFPVMPVEVCGFSLKPDGFFAGNPAVDLPRTRDPASREDGGGCCGGGAAAPACLPKSKM